MKNNKIFALSLAFVLMAAGLFCFAAPAGSGDVDVTLGANENATVNMYTGDTFTYAPVTNLPSSITASGSGMSSAGGFLSWSGTTLSGTAATAGIYTVVLTAVWTSGSLLQEATQTIVFNVHNKISVTSQSSVGALVGTPFYYTLSYSGPSDLVVGSPAISNANGLSWNAGTSQITGTPAAAGTTTFTWSLSSAQSGQTTSFVLTITSYNDLAITSSATSEGYVGQAYSITVQTSEPSASIAADITSLAGTGISWTSPTLSGTIASGAAPSADPFYQDYQVTFAATATIGGVTTTVQQLHTIRIYASLTFTSVPTISDVTATMDGLIGILTASISGAQEISIDWGDGNIEAYDVNGPDTQLTAAHEYSEEGSFLAIITAENDYGYNQALAVMYATGEIPEGPGDGGETDPEDDDEDVLHKWILPAAAILLIIAGIICAAAGPKALGAIFIIAGLLLLAQLYVYDIWEWLKELIEVRT